MTIAELGIPRRRLDSMPILYRCVVATCAVVTCDLGLAACVSTYRGSATPIERAELRSDAGWIVVDGVPWIAQRDREECGAASAAMVLAFWNVPATLDAVKGECPPQRDLGIRAGDLRDFVRRQGLQAYLIHGELDDLEHELARGRPVIVGLERQRSDGAVTHYAVVVAIHPAGGRVALLDPASGLQQDSWAGFLAEWQPVGRPALVVIPPAATTESAVGAAHRTRRSSP
jgi:hypothetical protein